MEVAKNISLRAENASYTFKRRWWLPKWLVTLVMRQLEAIDVYPPYKTGVKPSSDVLKREGDKNEN